MQQGKASFVLHLAQETEGPPLGLSATHLLSDCASRSQPGISRGSVRLNSRTRLLNTDPTAEAASTATLVTASKRSKLNLLAQVFQSW